MHITDSSRSLSVALLLSWQFVCVVAASLCLLSTCAGRCVVLSVEIGILVCLCPFHLQLFLKEGHRWPQATKSYEPV